MLIRMWGEKKQGRREGGRAAGLPEEAQGILTRTKKPAIFQKRDSNDQIKSKGQK